MPNRRLPCGFESLETRRLLAGDLQSPYQPLDTNLDSRVTAEDALALLELIKPENPAPIEEGLFPDVNGNGTFTPLDILIVINHFRDTNIAARLVRDSAFADMTNYDLLTNDPSLEIWASDFLEELELKIDGETFGDLSVFESQGRLLLSEAAIDSLLTAPLPDGDHLIEVTLPQNSAPISFTISVDRSAPSPILNADEGRLRLQQQHVSFLFTEPLAKESIDSTAFSVIAADGENLGAEFAVERVEQDDDQRLTVHLAQRLGNGEYQVELPAALCDLAGNMIDNNQFALLVNQTANLSIDPVSQFVTVETTDPTVSARWDNAAQMAVVATSPGPTVASRAYAMTHTAIYNAWSAFAREAISTAGNDDLQRPDSENTEANKTEAMSFAAYRVLVDLFPSAQSIFDDVMAELGFDPANETTDTTTPAGIGNVVAANLLAVRHHDGSNQLGDHPDGDGTPYSNLLTYTPANSPGNTADITLWTPEHVPIDATPTTRDHVQTFLTPHWGFVTPFALDSPSQFRPEAPQPFLLVDGSVDLDSETITLGDGSTVEIDRSLVGSIINPEFIAQAEHVIAASANLTDKQKLIAEFWEDAKHTSFPPGTWMTFGQFVSGRDENTLDEDAKLFLALSNAIFDASIATWDAKLFYDYTRPVRAIRELGKLGLIGEFDPALGGYAIEAWSPQTGSTQKILASNFVTYQTPGGDPSPPFAEYTSGHSSFSAAGATILELFTQDSEFGGEVMFQPGDSRFEPGQVPTETVILQWPTFRAAADEAGVSRIYGGIHFQDGDLRGRIMGNEVAENTWHHAQGLINPAGP